jgi:alpha-tubulin suppressor-like RCC1 family protein
MSAVIRRDASVWVWGNDDQGALGLGRPAAGAAPQRLAPVRIPGVANAKDIAIASGSSIVIADGTLRTWGDARLGATGRNGIERLASPTLVPNINSLVRVWASSYSNLGLTRDGKLMAWGSVFLAR